MSANVLFFKSCEKSICRSSLSLSISNVYAQGSYRFRRWKESQHFQQWIVFIGISEQCHSILTEMSCFRFGFSSVSSSLSIYHLHFLFIHRYQFLVYNASVIYFNYVRPFFRDGYRKYLCDSFQQVVDTLISLKEEPDYPWQAELLLYEILFSAVWLDIFGEWFFFVQWISSMLFGCKQSSESSRSEHTTFTIMSRKTSSSTFESSSIFSKI